MTRSTKAAVIGLLVVLIVAAVALVWYILQPQVLIDTDTLSVVRDGSTITVHGLVADETYLNSVPCVCAVLRALQSPTGRLTPPRSALTQFPTAV